MSKIARCNDYLSIACTMIHYVDFRMFLDKAMECLP